jgi:small subunit ribosomal protein S6
VQEKLRDYEIMLVLDPSLEEDALQTEVEKRRNIIESHGGKVESVDVWGRRKLAYEIRKQREGVYVLMEFQGKPGIAKELEQDLRVSETVIRHLTVLRQPKSKRAPAEPPGEPQAEQQDAKEPQG